MSVAVAFALALTFGGSDGPTPHAEAIQEIAATGLDGAINMTIGAAIVTLFGAALAFFATRRKEENK